MHIGLGKCEDTKGLIRSRKSKDRQRDGKKWGKKPDNDLQNTAQKTNTYLSN